jgi:putative transposase
MDFMHDQLFDGHRLRIFTLVDNYTKVCPALGVDHRYRGSDVVKTLDHAVREYGRPKRIFCDNGTEFVSKDLDLWVYANGVELDFSRPGKPTDNAFIEAFNSWFRKECLNQHWFLDLADARSKIEQWRNDYNMSRPHGAIGDLTQTGPTTGSGASTHILTLESGRSKGGMAGQRMNIQLWGWYNNVGY